MTKSPAISENIATYRQVEEKLVQQGTSKKLKFKRKNLYLEQWLQDRANAV